MQYKLTDKEEVKSCDELIRRALIFYNQESKDLTVRERLALVLLAMMFEELE
jgi:hypothetical protein